jgi:hypothetical protein
MPACKTTPDGRSVQRAIKKKREERMSAREAALDRLPVH